MDTNIFDPNYVQQQQIASLQRLASEQNNFRVQRYKQQCADWIAANIINRDRNLPFTDLPPIPRKVVISDEGNWEESTFPDLLPPTLPTPVVVPSGSIKSPTPAPDRLDQVLAILKYFNQRFDTLETLVKR
jgi:hypothetical protein